MTCESCLTFNNENIVGLSKLKARRLDVNKNSVAAQAEAGYHFVTR